MFVIFLAVFVIAIGFITAAIVNTVTNIMFGREGRFIVKFSNISSAVGSVMFFIFSGPYLLIGNGFNLWKKGSAPSTVLAGIVLTALLWSFCLGILMVQFLVTSGLLMY